MARVVASRVREAWHRLRTSRTSEWLVYRATSRVEPKSVAMLADRHFRVWSDREHINRSGIEAALECLGERPAVIIETGTSAWGTDSTRLWDAYVRWYGGEFWSVDLAPERSRRLAGQVSESTHLVVGDSVDFLNGFTAVHARERIGLAYLDSWDVVWEDPDPAAKHGLREWNALQPILGPGSVVVIDDTPASPGWILDDEARAAAQDFLDRCGYMPGKGSLVFQQVKDDERIEVVHHAYNLVLRLREDLKQ